MTQSLFKPEIERRYLLSGPPDLPMDFRAQLSSFLITQGYYTGPNSDLIRLRKTERPDGSISYHQTLKRGAGIERREHEIEIDEAAFTRNWPKTQDRRLHKRREQFQVGNQTWVIDFFTDRDLILAEVELDSVNQPPRIPDWLAAVIVREVTNEPAYLNCNLAE